MEIRSKEIRQYGLLNPYAKRGETVLFGGTSDRSIPISELLDTFGIEAKVYNRSFSKLCVAEAEELYDSCVEALQPKSVLLHIGEGDLDEFHADSRLFDNGVASLISHIKKQSPKCEITVISFLGDGGLCDMNRHLRQIADSMNCSFADITVGQVWNPKATKQVREFIGLMGYRSKAMPHDIARALYSI